jgi:hypothetical protein
MGMGQRLLNGAARHTGTRPKPSRRCLRQRTDVKREDVGGALTFTSTVLCTSPLPIVQRQAAPRYPRIRLRRGPETTCQLMRGTTSRCLMSGGNCLRVRGLTASTAFEDLRHLAEDVLPRYRPQTRESHDADRLFTFDEGVAGTRADPRVTLGVATVRFDLRSCRRGSCSRLVLTTSCREARGPLHRGREGGAAARPVPCARRRRGIAGVNIPKRWSRDELGAM